MDSIVVVGASLAGGRAAQTLRAEGFEGRITLIGVEPHPPYERPPLSKEILTGLKQASDTFLHPRDHWADLDIDLVLSRRATRLLAQERCVELDDHRSIRADKVLMCTGSRPRILEVPGADLPGIHYLRDLDDAIAIRDSLAQGNSLVVVGGGFIGAELAAAARSLGNDVTMLELDELPLKRVLGPTFAERLCRLHQQRGVQVMTGVGVARFEGDHRVRQVVATDDRSVAADLVVVGIGVEPNVELAAACGITVGNGILVDEHCRSSVTEIYAAGDVANHPNRFVGERIRLEHWQNAQNQGIAAARSMLGRGVGHDEVPWFWSDQYDTNIQVAGHPRPTDRIVWRGALEGLKCTAFYLRGSVLVGAIGINQPREVRAATKLIGQGAVVDPELLTDLTVDLRKAGAALAQAR